MTITTAMFAQQEGKDERAAQRLLEKLRANHGLVAIQRGLYSRVAVARAIERAGMAEVRP